VRRREFIAGLSGVAAMPFGARAQQADRIRRLGVLVTSIESDPEGLTWRTALVRRLQELGWRERRNLTIDYRFGVVGVNRMPEFAKELVALQPDVIFAGSTTAVAALRQSTFSIPIVFTQVPDPVEVGIVTSFARPSGNITGFTNFDPSIGGKWLQTLKDISPGINRVAFIFDPDNPSWIIYGRALEAAAPALKIRLTPAGARNAAEIERVMETLAREGGTGLVLLPSPVALNNRDSMIAWAAQHRLPAISPYRFFTTAGGLVSYGIDILDTYYRAASYVDRILRGEKPAELPVQAPTKYELAINLKTAKALGLTVPPTLIARADEVVE
jgi:putative ABC transport system substrate-binding protein